MLILDLTTGRFIEPETEQQQDRYPDEVLQSEWNPVVAEIQSVHQSDPKPSKPAPAVVNDAIAQLYRS